jgi:hypothetical protein
MTDTNSAGSEALTEVEYRYVRNSTDVSEDM